MSWLTKLTQVAAGRTKGKWHWWSDSICGYEPYTDGSKGPGSRIEIIKTDSRVYPPEDNDADFIITAANCFDELVAVAEAAKNFVEHKEIHWEQNCYSCRQTDILEDALAVLKEKVEGEGI